MRRTAPGQQPRQLRAIPDLPEYLRETLADFLTYVADSSQRFTSRPQSFRWLPRATRKAGLDLAPYTVRFILTATVADFRAALGWLIRFSTHTHLVEIGLCRSDVNRVGSYRWYLVMTRLKRPGIADNPFLDPFVAITDRRTLAVHPLAEPLSFDLTTTPTPTPLLVVRHHVKSPPAHRQPNPRKDDRFWTWQERAQWQRLERSRAVTAARQSTP